MNAFFNGQMLPCVDRFIAELADKIYTRVAPLETECYLTKEPVPFDRRTEGEHKTLREGEVWGGLWDCAWFRFRGVVPREAAGKKTVLKIDLSGEALICDGAGTPVRGLTSVTDSFDALLGSPAKTTYILTERAAGGEKIDLWADAGCNDLFGRYQGGTLKSACLATCDEDARGLWYDARFLRILLSQLDERSARYTAVLQALYEASVVASDGSPRAFKAARKVLKRELDKKGGDPSLTISALGHSHLDLAWLWPIRETRRKALRTFATAAANLEADSDYLFCASQPQQYAWVKEDSPALYDRVKALVTAGRIEPVGALWVEPDLNVTSGESLVRQVLYGKEFYRKEFGAEVDNAWLPDVFGFNAALPQILSKSGIKYLLTIKLSWNRFTRFPHHSFVWKGLDGTSEVLVHMPPEGTYNSAASPESVAAAERSYIEKGISENAMMLYGIGDGGGGPGSSHLENLRRMKNAAGLCPVRQRTAKEFFRLLNGERARLPVYKGEMYLQKHQGTYTTQGRNKRGNREMETALYTAELLSVMAADRGAAYPSEALERLWKETLLYQFHDILPGSSIARVYDESVARYETMLTETRALCDKALDAFGDERCAYFNPTSFDRTEIVDGESGRERVTLGAFGTERGEKAVSGEVAADDTRLENSLLLVRFGQNGEIVSLTDKRSGRELLTLGNRLSAYLDDGDAWDISDNYLLAPRADFTAERADTFCDGVKAVRTQLLRLGGSLVKQTVSLSDGEDFIRIDCEADWQESGKMLRADFTTTVVSDGVECDVQFGRLRRSTLENTADEFAMNEICAQKWVDYTQPDCGVAIVNDCKYGYRVKGSEMSVNLLRSPDYPGKGADRGPHKFTYLVYAHGAVSEVEKLAYRLVHPLLRVPADTPSGLFSTGDDHVVVEAVKKCESDDTVIVRLYENRGTNRTVRFSHPYARMEVTDMTERAGEPSDGTLAFAPFEIKTVKLYR